MTSKKIIKAYADLLGMQPLQYKRLKKDYDNLNWIQRAKVNTQMFAEVMRLKKINKRMIAENSKKGVAR